MSIKRQLFNNRYKQILYKNNQKSSLDFLIRILIKNGQNLYVQINTLRLIYKQ